MPFIGQLISLFTAICWTVTVISFEFAGKRVGSLPVNFIRLIIGFFLLVITLFIMDGELIPLSASAYSWNMLVISGLIGLVIGDFFLFQAFVDIGGRISLLIMTSVPIISIVLDYIFFNASLNLIQYIDIIIVLISIPIVILNKQTNVEAKHPHYVRGITFAFIGAFAQAIGLVFSKAGMPEGMNAFAATQIRIIAAIVGFIVIITVRKQWSNVKLAFDDTKSISFITLGSIFGPFLGVTSSLLALRYIELGIATTIAQLNIIMIIPFSVLMFKDKVNTLEIIASFTAFIGVVLLFIN